MKNLRSYLSLAVASFYMLATTSCSNTEDESPQIIAPKTWTSVAPGNTHTTAVRSDGSLWTWGLRANARIGINPIKQDSIPTRVGVASDWVAVASGQNHTIALKSNGTLWAIGANDWGQLGTASSELYRVTPTQIGTDHDWAKLAVGNNHAVAIKQNGQIYTWGSYNYPEWPEGLGATDTPVLVVSLPNTAKLAAGGVHNLALKTDGSLWAWGRNEFGELGNGTTDSMLTPLRIGTENNWQSVSAGRYHSIGLKTNGTLWAWGNNLAGQLGIGLGGADYYSPMQIGTDNHWKIVGCGITYGIAIKTDGSLWAWGNNYAGQLGDGSNNNTNMPIQIGNAKNWIAIYPGFETTFAKKADGTLWGWGKNENGQLGIGSTDTSAVPVLIPCPQS